MKKILATKIFIILGMVCLFFLVIPIIIGILSLIKLKKAQSSKELLALGILTLLFVSSIGGIIMLLITDEDLNKKATKK